MELILEKDLPHQILPVNAVSGVFEGVRLSSPKEHFKNPYIEMIDTKIEQNIKEIQKNIHLDKRGNNFSEEFLNLDIRMETGTGKTYVYTKTIYEMHKKYGFNKFIIIVPNLPIKAGTKQFIEEPYVNKHFKDQCGYETEIELSTLESVSMKKGKRFFPSEVKRFVKGSNQESKKIHVMLINMQLLTNGTMLSREDYDYGVEGYYRPFDAIRATRPVIILDEPHRFNKNQKAWQVITNELKPQIIVRYGATFPDIEIGKGKTKKSVKDYSNLLYDLGPGEAFNLNLIKGVAKEHFQPISKREEKVKITNIKSKTSCTLTYYKKNSIAEPYPFSKGESLSKISDAFVGLEIQGIGKDFIELSNGQIKYQGEEFSTDIYSTSYQEQMLKVALQRHFEVERTNFSRRNKIKTLALFFIADIDSYRQKKGSAKPTYLKNMFETLLLEQINTELENISAYEKEYEAYLLASKSNIAGCHGGYFAQDNDDSDEGIAEEVREILYEKKKLLSFKDETGNFNTKRFLFSKWTLKEGWDNPNVFTIAKLRSSGSENSKLQEVGRGLRLPVDEFGNRISNEDFRLNYIVDFTEADFAQRLIDQINGENPLKLKITDNDLESLAKILNLTVDDVFLELLQKKYIDRNCNIILENKLELFEEYPSLSEGVNTNKIVDRNKIDTPKIKINKDTFMEIKELWQAINQKYLLYYDEDVNLEMANVLTEIFKNDVFDEVVISSKREIITGSNEGMEIVEGTGVQYKVEKPIPYGEFLKIISNRTNIPIKVIHEAMIKYSKIKGNIKKELINEHSAANIVKEFNDWKVGNLQGRFNYKKASLTVTDTALTNEDGTPKDEIVLGRIGSKFNKDEVSKKYLYDIVAYDSPLEKENISTEIQEVTVYGKIPRRSISIPTITGINYSPDFMYVIKKKSGEKELNVIVETKDVEGKATLRQLEEARMDCAEVFFNQLAEDGYPVTFHKQLNNKKIKNIIDDVLKNK